MCDRDPVSRHRMLADLASHVVLVSVLTFLQLSVVLSQTSQTSVAGLLGFKSQVQDPSSVLASWQADVPPCNTSNCNFGATLPDCNWAGIACENWQIVALTVPCTPQPSGSPGDCALHTKVGGFPLNALTHITSLRAIDLDGNALAGTLPDAYAGNLQQLTVLLVGSNQLTGALPNSWGNITSMAVADFGNNNLEGQAPGSWGQWASLRGLRLTANFFKGPLPAEWGQWDIVEQLQLGGNMFTGTVPGSWSGMLMLQDLELQYNCAVCGALPRFPLQATGQLTINTARTSVGKSCSNSNCSTADSHTVLKAVVGTAAACFVLAMLLLRQWQVRRWHTLGYDTSATVEMRVINKLRRCCGLAPIAAPRQSSSSHRARTPSNVGAATPHPRRPRRPKQPQPSLVIMPDGQGLCFAVRLPDGNAAKDSLPDQPESSQHATSIAEPSAPTGSSHHQQAMPLTDSSIQQPVDAITGNAQQQPVSDITGGAQQQESIHCATGRGRRPAESEANDGRLQHSPPGDVETGSVARPANADLQRSPSTV